MPFVAYPPKPRELLGNAIFLHTDDGGDFSDVISAIGHDFVKRKLICASCAKLSVC